MLVSIIEAKTNFSNLINRALSGEEIIIAKDGTPFILLTPYTVAISKRRSGQYKGIINIPEGFDKPLPNDVLSS